jgi:hypothetical protein
MPERSRYAERRADGVCTSCGTNTPAAGRVRCEDCLEAARKLASERRELAATLGLCEACMRAKRARGKTRCNACAERWNERQRERERGK